MLHPSRWRRVPESGPPVNGRHPNVLVCPRAVALLVFGVAAALATDIAWNSGTRVGPRDLALSATLLGAFGLLLWLLGPSLGLS